MSQESNPYAAPATMTSDAQVWNTGLESLSKTGLGLTLTYYGIITVILAAIGTAVMGLLVSPIFALLGGLGVLVGWVMVFVGPMFCITVPRESLAKGLAIGTVVFQMINLVLGVGAGALETMANVFSTPMMALTVSMTLAWIANICGGIASILFILFLRKLAAFVNRDDLAVRATSLLMAVVILFVVLAASAMLSLAVPRFAMVMLVIIAIFLLCVFVMYVNLVNDLRKAIKVADFYTDVAHAELKNT